MAAGDDFQGIAAYAAAQHPDPNSRYQPQRQEFAGDPSFPLDGADFTAAAVGQFVKTDFSRQSDFLRDTAYCESNINENHYYSS